ESLCYFILTCLVGLRRSLDLKQAKAGPAKGHSPPRYSGRILSVLLLAKQVCDVTLFSRHGSLLFLRGRSWRRKGSELPDSGFVVLLLNNGVPLPRGRRSADRDSTTTTDTPAACPSARFDRAAAQRHWRTP